MGKRVKVPKYMINRNKYREIRAFNHYKMEQFISSIYQEGKAEGIAIAEQIMNNSACGVEEFIKHLEAGECKGVKSITARKIKDYAIAAGYMPKQEQAD